MQFQHGYPLLSLLWSFNRSLEL